MLELKKVNKYFNRYKKNELHVINNTSLTIKDNGLVALLGPSGCGKTTLLNTIGGLDKVKKGSIYINGEKVNSRLSSKVDRIRNISVGYIFQDYKLIDNLSVYDNVAITLKMLGIKDKQEIKLRVEYVLEKVGMLRYKKRPASMLSGGQQQRVGIARAIVKDPDIILSDEPTGNLDSKNSLEIMNIIEAISKDRLVLLVTHEVNLAKFYADRIIEIKDGTIINDYTNDHNDELDYRMDNRFYLEDFNNKISLKEAGNSIQIYSDTNRNINLEIVVENGNIYIKSNTQDKIEVVDDNSSLDFIHDHYKNIVKEDINKYEFNLKDISNNNIKKKYSSILNPISLLVKGFQKVFDYSILKKLLLVGFFLSGMFVMYSFSSIVASLTIHDEDFVNINREYLTITIPKVKVDDYLEYEKKSNINYLLPGDSVVNFNLTYDDYYQTSTITDTLTGSLSDINTINDNDLVYGTLPKDKYDVVVDELSITRMFQNNNYAKMAGITKPDDLIGRQISINNMPEFTITGITNKKDPSIYLDKSLFINIIANSSENSYFNEEELETSTIVDYDLYKDKITIKEGTIPNNDYEVIVNINNKESMPLNKEITTTVNNKKLKVVGYYTSKFNYNYYLVNNNTIKYNIIPQKSNITISATNKNKVLKEFRDSNLNINDSYTNSKNIYLQEKQEYIRNTLLVASVMLIISLVEIFLMIRSSFLSRVKEIGIYRAIGVKKCDIYKMFSGEIIAISTLASVPGIIIMAYILKVLSSIKYLNSYFIINIYIVLLTIIFIYIFNLIIGLLPVFNTIRKTPSSILSRHDVD